MPKDAPSVLDGLKPGQGPNQYWTGAFAGVRQTLHNICYFVGEALRLEGDDNFYHRTLAFHLEDTRAAKTNLEDHIIGAKHQDIIDWDGYLHMPLDGPKRLWWNIVIWEQAYQAFYGETSKNHPFTPGVKVHGIPRYEPFKEIWRPEDFEHFKVGTSHATLGGTAPSLYDRLPKSTSYKLKSDKDLHIPAEYIHKF